jgi:hypothetical protein
MKDTKDQTKEPTILGHFINSKVLLEFYETAAPCIATNHLELRAKATDSSKLQAENRAVLVGGLATSAGTKKADWSFGGHIDALLCKLSYPFELIAGFFKLGVSVDHRLKNPDFFKIEVRAVMINNAIKASVISERRALALLDIIKPTSSNMAQLEQILNDLKAIR